MKYELALSPGGRLHLLENEEGVEQLGPLAEDFGRSAAAGLFALAAVRGSSVSWPMEVQFWREFTNTFLHALAQVPEGSVLAVQAPEDLFFGLPLTLPAMRGAEYATPEVFASIWKALDAEASAQSTTPGGVKAWLGKINPALHLLGRVTFHLAENKRSPTAPFAFMATFTHRLTDAEKPVHLPLARALQEYAGAKNQAALRALLEPVQLAADRSTWAKDMLESRKIFQPQPWSPAQAHQFLKEAAGLEDCGIVIRIPNWWRRGKGPRPSVKVTVGAGKVAGIGVETLLKFRAAAALDGEELTEEEWETLMGAQAGLVLLRGQWVEVDKAKLNQVLDHWRTAQQAASEGVTFLEGMRLISGVSHTLDGEDTTELAAADWSQVVAGGWLAETLEHIRSPETAAVFDPNNGLQATLRPYQIKGVKWMWFLQSLGLGACLADDMGLGKTIQVISLLLQLRREKAPPKTMPSLLIAPASLLTNWRQEMTKFAPELSALTAHPSDTSSAWWREGEGAWKTADLIITTYGQAARLGWLAKEKWRLIILDEAQAIKNPGAQQTKAVKKLQATSRIALSGTPVENRPGDLWSLFDFLNPGLLGSAKQFTQRMKAIQKADRPDYAPLRRLVQPWILRRLKTDRSIISDLPDKTEMTVSCGLTKKQVALYHAAVLDLQERLEKSSGIERKGLVLAFLMRFKQICNHPSQGLSLGDFNADDSGKFLRLQELCEEIASRQEKVLVFTQFQEMTEPLAAALQRVFGRPGLILHGGTPVKQRQGLVAEFQREGGPPFFVLSLKAGGSGLTLTAASHVFHFDRWWNPAVENQATDRAFRIGQKKNVLVHKFVTRGTLEERIDAMIKDKQALAESLLGAEGGAESAAPAPSAPSCLAESLLGAEGGAEKLLTEMDNAELLRFVSLDITSAGAGD